MSRAMHKEEFLGIIASILGVDPGDVEDQTILTLSDRGRLGNEMKSRGCGSAFGCNVDTQTVGDLAIWFDIQP